MDEDKIVSVRVVETQTDYVAQVKNAAVASVVTVIVTSATMAAMGFLTNRLSARSKKTETETIVKPTDPEV